MLITSLMFVNGDNYPHMC